MGRLSVLKALLPGIQSIDEVIWAGIWEVIRA